MKFELWIHSKDAAAIGQMSKIQTRHDYCALVQEQGARAGLREIVLTLIPAESTGGANYNAAAARTRRCRRPMITVLVEHADKLSPAAIEAIIAHEVGHLKLHHYRFKKLNRIYSTFCWKRGVPSLALSWIREYRADAHALRAVGIGPMRAFYNEVLSHCDEPRVTHPDGPRRMRRMERLQRRIERKQSLRQLFALPA